MSGSEEGKTHELVIIRRRANSEEGGHHGGVWKIAYADFMTAMMAFFLVMWLINSTDKKTLTQVATYFNPLRLTDKRPAPKGLHEPDGSESAESATSSKGAKGKDSKGKGATKRDDSEIGDVRPRGEEFQRGNDAQKQEVRVGVGGDPDQSVRQATGRAFRDPFDPAPRSEIAPSKPSGGRSEKVQPPPATVVPAEPVARQPASDTAERPPKDPAKDGAKDPAKDIKDATKAAEREAAERADAAGLEAAIRKAITEALPGSTPHLDVTVVPEGVLISLTDDYEFGMFAIASAEPRPAMVVIMDKLSRILVDRPEPLIVRGHTDRRPYRTATYDNWRLSAARAHMAYVMLARGGIDEKRFERIEGYADRSLRIADDPEAAQNRRIEILLRKPTP